MLFLGFLMHLCNYMLVDDRSLCPGGAQLEATELFRVLHAAHSVGLWRLLLSGMAIILLYKNR
jgi:hypothetical protein